MKTNVSHTTKITRPQTNKVLGLYIASVTLFMTAYTVFAAYQYL
jgi:D-alanyl-D-alanine carboxypeptidase